MAENDGTPARGGDEREPAGSGADAGAEDVPRQVSGTLDDLAGEASDGASAEESPGGDTSGEDTDGDGTDGVAGTDGTPGTTAAVTTGDAAPGDAGPAAAETGAEPGGEAPDGAAPETGAGPAAAGTGAEPDVDADAAHDAAAAADAAEPLSFEEHLPLLTHGGTGATRRPSPVPRRPPPEAEPRPQAAAPNRTARATRGFGRVVLALLSMVALVGTGYAYATLDGFQDNVNTTDALLQSGPAPPKDDGAIDILLVGTDARTDMQGNPLPLEVLKALRTEETQGVHTDTLIVLRLPKNGGKPSGVSIPRDAWVDVPAGGQNKVNSAFGTAKESAVERLRADGVTDGAEVERESDQAGRKALVKTVQDLTQVRIDHYAEVSLLGFYLLTEALGGVEVCLNDATEDKDSGADFRAGPQTVSGGEALSFVRQRKNLPRGDLDRIIRQQSFLASALHQVLSAGTLTSPTKLNQLTDAVQRSIVLDPDLDLLEFAEQVKGVASGDVGFVTVPVLTLNGRSPDGQSIVEVDPNAVRQFVAGLATPDPPTAGGGGAPAGGALRQITAGGVSCVN